jgi:hypothetical protein
MTTKKKSDETTIRTVDDAKKWLETMLNELGMGFHPDTPTDDYVWDDGKRYFSKHQVRLLERQRAQVFAVLEAFDLDVYREGLRIARRLGLYPLKFNTKKKENTHGRA